MYFTNFNISLYYLTCYDSQGSTKRYPSCYLKWQTKDTLSISYNNRYPLHGVYQIITKDTLSIGFIRLVRIVASSLFEDYYVPCTLKTESETKVSPGFSIDIISGILNEWILLFSQWAIFTAISFGESNYHFHKMIYKHLWIFIVIAHWIQQSLVWHNRDSNLWSTALRRACYLTISLPMWFRHVKLYIQPQLVLSGALSSHLSVWI